jgi:hypothetical protein
MSQSDAARQLYKGFDSSASVQDELMRYSAALETAYRSSMDIEAFIFGLRCFFSWHSVDGFEHDKKAHKAIRDMWLHQTDGFYNTWLTSGKDDTQDLLWSKWTFQAKSSIFEEWLQAKLLVYQSAIHSETIA